jgi:SNF family Na+-dependent transporter
MTAGRLFGTLWFLLLFFAGFTSAIAMYNYLVTLIEEEMGVKRNVGSILVFGLYIIIGLPVALEGIFTKKAELFYLSELDNWVGSYFLVVLGLLEVIVAGWLMGDKALEEMNKGGYWKVPKWFFNLFVRFLAPVYITILLVWSTINYYKDGYFKLVPKFAEQIPELIPWVQGARVVVLSVLIIGFVQSYRSIKRKYADEIREGKVLVVR